MIIRKIKHNEIDFLKEMLYTALYVPEGQPPFPKSILNHPDISKYIENWGTLKNDLALVAVINNEPIGAIWGRTFSKSKAGYGFIDEKTPEICMAVKEKYRNKGIGSKLIDEISKIYLSKGSKSISLSVDKLNKASLLYKRKGFLVVGKDKDNDFIMKKILKKME
ncbi:MAG: GNAT family N-acetyltransferase [Bacteroidales bacterium]|nr:GNAT family N-acetyltransferase [Bacteroidales bacterium]